jgi:hypothetical protein
LTVALRQRLFLQAPSPFGRLVSEVLRIFGADLLRATSGPSLPTRDHLQAYDEGVDWFLLKTVPSASNLPIRFMTEVDEGAGTGTGSLAFRGNKWSAFRTGTPSR